MTRFDVAVVGGGINGGFVALEAARAGLSVIVLERAYAPGEQTTLRSGGLVRLHYPTAAETWLAVEGRRIYAQGGLGFERTGFLRFAAPDEDLPAASALVRELGGDSEVVGAETIRRLDPTLAVGDDERAAWEPASGYAEAAVTMAALRKLLCAAGVEVRRETPARALAPGDGVVTDGGLVRAERIVLAAGAWSATLAAMAGVELAITPTAIHVLRLTGTPPHRTLIDPPSGIYLRPIAGGGTIAGLRMIRDLPLDAPDDPLPPPPVGFAEDVLARLARRVPGAAGARVAECRAGQLDMTPDGRPLLGPCGGLWLACGWSGTGFKSAPAAGRALTRWMLDGAPPHPSLAELRPDRPFSAAGARSPH